MITFIFLKKGKKNQVHVQGKCMVNKNIIVLFCEMPIEPHLVLKHISYINTPKNPFFKLVTRVNTRDFTAKHKQKGL
jgi:hypothetical protein